jgi:hypothetical protein
MADMPFTIGEPCIDVMDKSRVDECPVDCIYEGAHKLYINPAECIDCGNRGIETYLPAAVSLITTERVGGCLAERSDPEAGVPAARSDGWAGRARWTSWVSLGL